VIHANILKRQADEGGLAASAVERDYVLAHVLAAIARRDKREQIVFKGGTALRLCHFESYRYSADLDFSLVNDLGLDGARKLVADALVDCKERVGFPSLRLNDATPPRIESVPILDPGRWPDVDVLWDLPPIAGYPFDGSAIVYWDTGPVRPDPDNPGQTIGVPPPPLENVPNRAGEDPHGAPRGAPEAVQLVSEFLQPGGAITDVCAGGPCHAGGWTGP